MSTFFTIMCPCIVTNFFKVKPTRCTNFTNLFWHETLNVSDSWANRFSVNVPRLQHSGLFEIIYIGQSCYIHQDPTNRRQIHFRRSHQICCNTRIELNYRPGIFRETKGARVEKAKNLLT